jgi:hypothetical protein
VGWKSDPSIVEVQQTLRSLERRRRFCRERVEQGLILDMSERVGRWVVPANDLVRPPTTRRSPLTSIIASDYEDRVADCDTQPDATSYLVVLQGFAAPHQVGRALCMPVADHVVPHPARHDGAPSR